MAVDLDKYLLSTAKAKIGQIGIRLVEGDVKRWLRALRRVESRMRYQANETPRLQALDYMHLVTANIMNQTHMAGYAPYHPRYAAWKAERGTAGGGFWRLFGDLVKAMSYWKTGNSTGGHSWFGGVPAGVKDSGGKSWASRNTPTKSALANRPKEIAWYGHIMEEGGVFAGQRHPARAVFGPTLNEYRAHGAKVRGRQALGHIRRHWR